MSQAPPLTWNLNGLFFDAWLRQNHNSSITITQHPVETGAAITDNSYVNPRRFSFDIGMTDVASSPAFPGSSSRSINAYTAIVNMQRTRNLLTLTSKYYSNLPNVLIESIDVSDDFQTLNALKATITLLEVILVSTQVGSFSGSFVSQNPQATDQTNRGQVAAASLVSTAATALINYGIQFAVQAAILGAAG